MSFACFAAVLYSGETLSTIVSIAEFKSSTIITEAIDRINKIFSIGETGSIMAITVRMIKANSSCLNAISFLNAILNPDSEYNKA
jgi:hypothetical protein